MKRKARIKRIIVFMFIFMMAIFYLPMNELKVQAASEWEFSYTGSIQEWTCPYSGTYQLEVYGAAGGDAGLSVISGPNRTTAAGGKGGYSKGTVTLTAGTKLYIVVGGKGADSSPGNRVNAGGYNGGGNGADAPRSEHYWVGGGGGGGATHIATQSGVLSSLASNPASVLIVAGGGGAASRYYLSREQPYPEYGFLYYSGGAGGGLTGEAGQGDFPPSGGTQTSGGTATYGCKNGSFGQGGGGYQVGGGGGYYGGGGKLADTGSVSSASGGSGYIGGVTGGSTTSGVQSGNGYAKITALHTHSYTSSVTTAATCTANGVKTYTCTCGDSYTEAIAALGHSPSGWQTNASQHWKVCTRSGCGVITTAAANHTYGSWVVDTAATCTTAGSKHRDCTVCGYRQTETIAATGHTWPVEYTYGINNGITNGLAYKNCTICNSRLETKWLNRIRVRYQNADETYGTFTNVVNTYNASGESISWSRGADETYQEAGTTWISTSSAKSEDITVYRNKVTLELNSWLDSVRKDTLENYATADVYINGVQVADDVTDYTNTELLYGATYEITDIKVSSGYTFNGIHEGTESLSGILNGSKSIEPDFTTNEYKVIIRKGTGISAATGDGIKKYGTSVTIDATVKPGYTWKEWTGTYNTTTKQYTFTMPAENVDVTATATANTDTPYVVRHWKQNLDGGDEQTAANYTIADTDNLVGTTDTSVTPAVKTYEGFTSPEAVTVNVDGDGSRVVDYYYSRNSYTVSLTAGTGISSVSGSGTYRFGADISINAELIAEPPYQFVKWTGTEEYESDEIQLNFTMPAHDIELTANATLVSCVSFDATYNTPVEVGKGIDIGKITVIATYSNGDVKEITGDNAIVFVEADDKYVTTIVKKEAETYTFDVLYLFNGFKTYGTVDVTFIDTTAPSIDTVKYEDEWVQTLDITIPVSDNSSGPLKYFMSHEKEYTKEELAAEAMQEMKPGELTMTLHDNGDFYFYVIDPSGNMSGKEIIIKCVDDVPPAITPWLVYQEKGMEKKISPEEQISGDIQYVTFEIDAVDAETAIKRYRYKEQKGEWSEWQLTNSFPGIYMNGTYLFEVEDVCGNVGTVTVQLSMLSQKFEVHYLDVDQNGTILCETVEKQALNSSVSGAELGTETTTGAYYEGYDYVSCDTAVVQTTGATVHRYFKIHEYTVTYHDEAGNIIATEKIPYGSTSTISNDMTKDGTITAEGIISYVFKGWGKQDGTIINTAEVKEDMSLYPVYEKQYTEIMQQNEELYVEEIEETYDYQAELEAIDITAVGTEPEYIEQAYEATIKAEEQNAGQEQFTVTFISEEKTALGKFFEAFSDPQVQRVTKTTVAVTGTAIGLTIMSALMQLFSGAGLIQSIVFGYVLLRKKVRYVRGAWMMSEENVKYVDKYGRKLEVESCGKQTVFKRKGKILYAVNVEELVTRLQTGRISYSQFEEEIAKSEVYTAFSKDVGIEVYNVKAQSGQVKKKMVGFNLSGNIKNMMKGLGDYTVRINNNGKQIMFDVKYAIQNA